MQCGWLLLLPGYTSGSGLFSCLLGLKAFPKELIPACLSPDCVFAKAPLSWGQKLFLSIEFHVSQHNIPRSLWMLSPSLNVIPHSRTGVIFSNEMEEISEWMLIRFKNLEQLMCLERCLSTSFVTKFPGKTWPINHDLLSSNAQSVYYLSGNLLPGLYFWNENTVKSSNESPTKIHINYTHFFLLFSKSERSTK